MSNNPVRLHKKEQNNGYSFINSILNKITRRLEAWVLTHATLCLFLIIIGLSLLFVIVMMAICGVSAVESGTYYNHIGDAI